MEISDLVSSSTLSLRCGPNNADEILLSKDKTVAIIDGSGVLYDPAGLDRAELVRLAKARSPINFFAKEKLGPEGYQILVDQKDIQLPCKLSPPAPLEKLTPSRRDHSRWN